MYTVRSVDIRSSARVAGALYGALALLVVPVGIIGVIAGFVKGNGATVGLSVVMVAAPLLYGVVGFLLGAFAAWIYNLVAGRIGGIEIELGETSHGSPSTIQLDLK